MKAKEIVRALATAEPPCDSEYAICPLCKRDRAWSEDGHRKKCPWRQARKWTAKHPLPVAAIEAEVTA